MTPQWMLRPGLPWFTEVRTPAASLNSKLKTPQNPEPEVYYDGRLSRIGYESLRILNFSDFGLVWEVFTCHSETN
jgi:hypothetical protein